MTDDDDPGRTLGLEPGDRAIDLGHGLIVGRGVAAMKRPRHFGFGHQRALIFQRAEDAAVEAAGPRTLTVKKDDPETLQARGRTAQR